MPRLAPDLLVPRSDRAWNLKRRYYGLFTEAWRYAAPGIDPYRGSGGDPEVMQQVGTQGQPRHQHLFDSTLARSALDTAGIMANTLFPPGQDWAEMQEGPFFAPEEGEPQRRREALVLAGKRIFQAIHASNFPLAVQSMIFDGVVSGTGCMKVGISADAATLLEFDAVNQAEVAFERGARGDVWAFYRKMDVPASHLSVMWPQATQLPKVSYEDGQEKTWPILECTYYGPETGEWYYDVILRKTDKGDVNRRIFEREYVVCPWIVWRYMLPSGDVQGRCRTMAALPDARTANHAVRVRLQSASIRVAGMWTYKAEDVFNPKVVEPQSGAFLPVGSNDSQNPTIRALELPGDPQMGELVLEDTRAAIKETMLDLVLPEQTGPVRSPTEYMVREREYEEKRGQPYGRLVEEVARPVLRIVAHLMGEAGQLPELAAMQPALPDGRPAPLRLDGTDVQVQFTNPMTKAQKMADAESIVRWAEMSQFAAGPEGWMAAAKTEDIPAVLNERIGAPPELVRDQEERAAREEEARMAMQQQQGGGQPQQAQAQAMPV